MILIEPISIDNQLKQR